MNVVQAVDLLAKELHKDYRAARKALGDTRWDAHDHGWAHCNRKDYFRKRATAKLRKAWGAHGKGEAGALRDAVLGLLVLCQRRQGSNPTKVSGAGNSEAQVVVEARRAAQRSQLEPSSYL